MSPAKSASAVKFFKAAERPAAMSDADFRKEKDSLRLDLIRLQQRLRELNRCPALIVLAGVRGAGIIDTLNVLNTWMDPRWIKTFAFDDPSDEERERPPFWRYWRALPAAGTMGLFLEGWYGELLGLDPARPVGRGPLDERLRHIAAFEQTLADSGTLILKFWMHLSESQQRRSAKDNDDDPVFGFRLADHQWRAQPPYQVYIKTAANVIAATNTDLAPWHIVPGGDANHRRFVILGTLRAALKRHLKHARAEAIRRAAPAAKVPKDNILARVDLSASMSEAAYKTEFHTQQTRLYKVQQTAREAGVSSVVALEGWDAAGKGGAIRRLTYGLSATNYKVVPIQAPTEEERAHHYLWRFWRELGRAGRMTIFDRSWYGRVLVERVDGLASKAAWSRAYDEINAFEEQLTSAGIVLLKFWLHIDRDEQLQRFQAREKTAHKRWKLTQDDWRNRKKWNAYLAAANDMIKRTSTTHAPWHLVPANDKHYARIFILRAVADALEKALRRKTDA